jgi:DNA modification methylase
VTVRTKKPKPYTPIVQLPALSADEAAALKANIALNGVMVPILVDEDRRIIDGSHRKRFADELGYDCPEVVQEGLAEEEKRTLARALNLARRQLDQQQKREVIAEQLAETPGRSNRWIGKALGVHHATVASVRVEMESSGQIIHCERLTGSDGREQPSRGEYRPSSAKSRSSQEQASRLAATTLLHGDCRSRLRELPPASVDVVISDPIYPEIQRGYGRISEEEWHGLMRDVVRECRRVLKPKGSALFILQPNYERLGRMRLWLYEFVLWAAKEWNLIQDAYWHAPDAIPAAGANRQHGLLRTSVKWCVWLGPADCYRNQDRVLKSLSEPVTTRTRPDDKRTSHSGRSRRCGTMHRTAIQRGGSTPYNLLSIPKGGGSPGSEDHPAVTPYTVAEWWVRYLLPPNGILLDPFCGSGTMLEAGLDHGASRVYGIDQEADYLAIVRRRLGT